MTECRAAVITAHNQPLEIRNVKVPELEPGAMLVRIVASTLCGTDVHRWHGPLPRGDSLPVITGHEPCGVVEEINGAKTDILGRPVKPGDRVVWNCLVRVLLLLLGGAAAVLVPQPRVVGA